MTGLFPGFLFPSTGLNRTSTPIIRGQMLSKKERKLERGHFNERPRPKSSPVSSVYDVCNSSTCLIILNNKLSSTPKGSRLRGQTDITGDIVKPDPDRHAHQAPDFTEFQNHRQCIELHQREFTRLVPTPTSVRRSQCSPWKISNASRVNPTHHASCHSPQQHEDITQRQASLQRSQMRTSFRGSRPVSSILGDFRLSRDDRAYLSSIADAYSIDDIRRGKLLQCNELFWHAISQGGYSLPDLLKYSKYMLKPNTKKHTTSKHKRGKSAHERRAAGSSYVDVDGPIPNTDHTHLKSSQARSTYQTDTTSPHLKTAIDYNRTLVQNSPGKVRSLTVGASSETSLLSLMLGMSDGSSKSRSLKNRSLKSRQSDKVKAESRTEGTEQNGVAEEDGSYDIQTKQRIGVDKELIDAEEDLTHEYVNYGAEQNYEAGYLGKKGSAATAYEDVTSAHENKIIAQDTVTDLDTEKHAHVFNGTRQLHTDNEETEDNSFQEFSRQVYQKHSQEMSEFNQQQTAEVEQPHLQQVLSQEGENESRQSVFGDESLRMAYEQTTDLKEDEQERRRILEIVGENITSDSASVLSDSSGGGGDRSTTVFHLDTATDLSDERGTQ